MLRLLRPVCVGAGAAAVAGGILYGVQHHQISKLQYQGFVCPEWGIETRSHIYRACASHDYKVKINELSKAVDSIVSRNTNLNTKSIQFLTGYCDLLTLLGLQQLKLHMEGDALDALKTAYKMPFGSVSLRAENALALYELGEIEISDLIKLKGDLNYPKIIDNPNDLKSLGKLTIEVCRHYLKQKNTELALSEMLSFHKSIKTSNDPLCLRATLGGYIGQAWGVLGEKEMASGWLLRCEKEASECGTNACRETLEVAKRLNQVRTK